MPVPAARSHHPVAENKVTGLDDAALANATIWAPTDAGFAKLGDEPKSLSPDELQAVLGFHITPPRRLITAPQP